MAGRVGRFQKFCVKALRLLMDYIDGIMIGVPLSFVADVGSNSGMIG